MRPDWTQKVDMTDIVFFSFDSGAQHSPESETGW